MRTEQCSAKHADIKNIDSSRVEDHREDSINRCLLASKLNKYDEIL
jgi:hypothetical protein